MDGFFSVSFEGHFKEWKGGISFCLEDEVYIWLLRFDAIEEFFNIQDFGTLLEFSKTTTLSTGTKKRS